MPQNTNTTFDAIVIGTGISGGWAAKELCEGGLKTLVLERGRDVEHIVDYPTADKDIESWYTYVEKYIGVCGEALGLPQLPDGYFSPPMELNVVEKEFKAQIHQHYNDRTLTIGRFANITGTEKHEDRHHCAYRNRCMRGCTLGGYFSSNASTLPAAQRTGNMTLRPYSIAHEIIYDDNTKKAIDVRVIDAQTNEKLIFYAKVIFCCASTVDSTSLLLQSKSERFPRYLVVVTLCST